MGLVDWLTGKIGDVSYNAIRNAVSKTNETLNGVEIDNIFCSTDKNLKLFLGRHHLKKLVTVFDELKSNYPKDVILQNYIKKIVPELKNIIKCIDNLKENTTTDKEVKRRFFVVKTSINLVKDIENLTSNFKSGLLQYPSYLNNKDYKDGFTNSLKTKVFDELDNWVNEWKDTYRELKSQGETLDKQSEARNKKEMELRKKNRDSIKKCLENARIFTNNYVISSGANQNNEVKNLTVDSFTKSKQVEIPTFIKGCGLLINKSLKNCEMAVPTSVTIPINYKLLAVKKPCEDHKELESEI